jgi:choline dehydrogenase-like flavoprotein
MNRSAWTRRDLLGAAVLPLAAGLLACRRRPRADHDVCVIGSGFAGAFLALRLAERGIRTVVVEAGPRLTAEDPPAGRIDLLPIECSGSAGFSIDRTRTIGLGGTSRRWSGVLTRLSPADFQASAQQPGLADWPLRYGDLEPFYCQAEAALGVRGGRAQRRAEPPRACPYPFEQKRYFSPAGLFPGRDLAFFPLPFASRGGAGGALRLDEVEIPKLMASPAVTVLAERTAIELRCAGGARASALVVRREDGATEQVRARHYVVAAGVAESARLLLASRHAGAPSGLGNQSGFVGSRLTAHPAYRFEAPRRAGQAPKGGIHRTYSYADALRREGCGAAHADLHLHPESWMVEMMLETQAVAGNRLALGADGKARLRFDWTDRDRRTIARCAAIAGDLAPALSPQGAPTAARAPLWFHPAGLCRMAAEPAAGVVDRDCRVFGTENVWLAGAAVFPYPGSANPTLTVVALALRLADRLSDALRA